MDRRKFIKILGAAGVTSLLPLKYDLRRNLGHLGISRAWAFQTSPKLAKFVQPLPMPGTGIPVMTRSDDPIFGSGVDYYQVIAGEFTQQLHPDLPAPGTKLWGYADNSSGSPVHKHLGGIILARRGRPVRIRFKNSLPPAHILPVDTSIFMDGAEGIQNRMAIHLHGGEVPWFSDGGPYNWWDPDYDGQGAGHAGTSFINGPGGALEAQYPAGQQMGAGEADYLYPNDQSARLVWYHDHAIGITRLNAHAGLASGYVIGDGVEDLLIAQGAIPSTRVFLIFQDKTFIGPSGNPEPGAVTGTGYGDLWYPSVYDPSRWELATGGSYSSPPVPSCVPEAFADTMLVNGVVSPFLEVQARKYRFTLLNACNARFLRIKLVKPSSSDPTEPDYINPTVGPPIVQIGTEGGFLTAPVTFTGKSAPNTLLLAPAERAEIIIDFSGLTPGTRFILYNDAAAPFPGGDPLYDFWPGATDPLVQPFVAAGMAPNTRTIMQFRVVPRVGLPDRAVPLRLPAMNPASLLPVPTGTYVRTLTLNEGFDGFGRLTQLIGNAAPGGIEYKNSITSGSDTVITAGTTEVWRIFNLTGDAHPMHFHLVNVQVVSRQPFDQLSYTGTGSPPFTGPARGPDPNERGWKETVKMYPAECTTVIANWKLADMSGYKIGGPSGTPLNLSTLLSPRTTNNEYVWHCHILEHEEHDMMNTIQVV
jgi:spore coat protein A, manganese oxidase